MDAMIVAPGAGRVLRSPTPSATGTVTVKVATGSMTMYVAHRAADDAGGPPEHRHDFDETFYVIEGEWRFTVGGRCVRAGAGTVVHVPGGALHAFRSSEGCDASLLAVAVPGGIERYFEEAARTADQRSAGRRSGIQFVDEGRADAWCAPSDPVEQRPYARS